MAKYVILLYFYIKVEQNYQQKKKKKHKKYKNTRSNKIKKNPTEHLYHEISNNM